MGTRVIGRVLCATRTAAPCRSAQVFRLPHVIHGSPPPRPHHGGSDGGGGARRTTMPGRSFASSSSGGGGRYPQMAKRVAIFGAAGLAAVGCAQIVGKEMNPHDGDIAAGSHTVVVETISPGTGPPVTTDHTYRAMVTLYIEGGDRSRTPSGWSTRMDHGADADDPFEFQPGVNLIEGWSRGVLEMREGERALLHVPAALGYVNFAVGSKGGAFYVPAGSDLIFDIEVLGKKEKKKKKKKKRKDATL